MMMMPSHGQQVRIFIAGRKAAREAERGSDFMTS